MNPFRVAIVGFGQIAYGYALNEQYSSEHKFATHTQALLSHESFILDTVIAEDLSIAVSVKDELGIKHTCLTAEEVPEKEKVDVVVFACPPRVDKIKILENFPNVKAVFLEKPITESYSESVLLENYLKNHNIKAQVSFIRRGDKYLLSLANGSLQELVGDITNVQIIYGNGLRNNGSHMIDLTRMLLGEVKAILHSKISSMDTLSIKEDKNVSFMLEMKNGAVVAGLPIDFNYFRENSMDIWGSNGRLALTQEGSYFQYWGIQNSRFGFGYKEIDWSAPEAGKTLIGESIYTLYDNLNAHLLGKEELLSSLESALVTEQIIHDILKS
jgi:predicted dehydrogenase